MLMLEEEVFQIMFSQEGQWQRVCTGQLFLMRKRTPSITDLV